MVIREGMVCRLFYVEECSFDVYSLYLVRGPPLFCSLCAVLWPLDTIRLCQLCDDTVKLCLEYLSAENILREFHNLVFVIVYY